MFCFFFQKAAFLGDIADAACIFSVSNKLLFDRCPVTLRFVGIAK